MDKKKGVTWLRFSNNGFTLIELMVAITIVAILATIGIITYSTSQKTARVNKRAEDLKALASAIELLRATTGSYTAQSTWACIPAAFAPTYIQSIPNDPSDPPGINTHCYQYRGTASEFKVRTNPQLFTDGEMVSADFIRKPNMVDPARDYNNIDPNDKATCTVPSITPVAGKNVTAWAIYSGDTACRWF